MREIKRQYKVLTHLLNAESLKCPCSHTEGQMTKWGSVFFNLGGANTVFNKMQLNKISEVSYVVRGECFPEKLF